MPKVRGGEATAAFKRRLGRHVRAARDGVPLTQAQLAEAIGVEPQSISDWETGRSQPTCENLAAICNACNVSSAFLLSERLRKAKGSLEADAEHLAAILGARRVAALLTVPEGRLKREIDIALGAFLSGEAVRRRQDA